MKLGHKTKNTLKYSKFGLKVRTGWEQFEAKSAKTIRTAEPEQNFTGSYKNKRVYLFCTWLIYLPIPRLSSQNSLMISPFSHKLTYRLKNEEDLALTSSYCWMLFKHGVKNGKWKSISERPKNSVGLRAEGTDNGRRENRNSEVEEKVCSL